MKLCIQCKYYAADTLSYGGVYNRRCLHPKFLRPIDGDGTPLEYAREESKKCGHTGKLWEQREPPKPGWFARTFLGAN